MKSKLIFSVIQPDNETIEWAAAKIRHAYLRELDAVFKKAQEALSVGKSAVILTKQLRIEIAHSGNTD